MQEKYKIIVLRSLALLTFATGLYVIRPVWQPRVDLWLHLRSHALFWFRLPELFHIFGTYAAVLGILFEVVLIGKFTVAYGLFRLRPWARPTAIGVLTADFVFRAAGAINMFLIEALVPPTPLPPMPDGSVMMTIPIWPSYVTAIISIAIVLILIQKPIKTVFQKEAIA